MGRKNNPNYTKEQLEEAVSNSKNIGQVIEYLTGSKSGAKYDTIRKYIELWNINSSHFDPYDRHRKQGLAIKIPMSEILVENSKYTTSKHLKNRLYKEGYKLEVCEICGQDDKWNGTKLILQLDHKNGISNDNRIDNLRILCPNCHTQTKTWGAKKR